MEVWKDVNIDAGLFHDRYMVSSLGNIKSLPHEIKLVHGGSVMSKEKIISPKMLNNGYMKVTLSYGKRKLKNRLVHRIVASAFIENSSNKKEVNHKDCNRANNLLTNLEWATSSENKLHALKYGKMKTPDKSTVSKGDKHYKRVRKRLGIPDINSGRSQSEIFGNNLNPFVKGHTRSSGESHPTSKVVLEQWYGIFYISAKEAAKIAGIDPSDFTKMLRGEIRNKTNFIYA